MGTGREGIDMGSDDNKLAEDSRDTTVFKGQDNN